MSSAVATGVRTGLDPFPIVRFHYTKARREWSTYWRDRNLRFHRFDLIPPSGQVEDLLGAVDADSTGIFWG